VHRSSAGAVCGILSSLLWVSLAHAQSVTVRITEAETGHPIFGAFVTLLDHDGQGIRSALTNEQGLFLFILPQAGRYSVRAQMMGRETRETPELEVGEGDRLVRNLALSVRAIELEGIAVEGSARCTVRPGQGERTAAVWEEARKALEVASWALREEVFRYQVVQWVREYGPEGRRILHEDRRGFSGFYREPFRSLPAQELAEKGFIQTVEGEEMAFAPDAAVLLSDPFLDTHCFRIRRGEEEALIGLEFEPVARRRTADIRGVLWLDLRTSELRSVDFRYTGHLYEGREDGPGGWVEFERLPSGVWIVRSWSIRMPIMGEAERRIAGRLVRETNRVGYREEGGEVLRIRDRRGELVTAADRALLSGTVYDSLRNAPLAGAQVFLSGTDWVTQTDGEGRFRMADLPGGSYMVEVFHPLLDSLGLKPPPRPVELTVGRMTWVDLAVGGEGAGGVAPGQPRQEAIPRELGERGAAGARPSAQGTGMPGRLAGRVVGWEDGTPLGGVEITLPTLGSVAVSDQEGRFVFPAVTPGSHLVRAALLGRGVVEDTLALNPGESLHIEFRLRVQPIPVDGLVVEVERRDLGLELVGFFDRRDREQGIFFTREQIEGRNPVSVVDLFQGIPGARVIVRDGIRRAVSLVGSRAMSLISDPYSQPCYPSVWIDQTPHVSPQNTEPIYLDDLVRPSEIAGMEIYQSTARIPVRYNLGGACGVIVIWTRSGSGME
jgi:hypothetical protein